MLVDAAVNESVQVQYSASTFVQNPAKWSGGWWWKKKIAAFLTLITAACPHSGSRGLWARGNGKRATSKFPRRGCRWGDAPIQTGQFFTTKPLLDLVPSAERLLGGCSGGENESWDWPAARSQMSAFDPPSAEALCGQPLLSGEKRVSPLTLIINANRKSSRLTPLGRSPIFFFP